MVGTLERITSGLQMGGTDPKSLITGALLGPVQIRELAERLGVRPTKTLGQNFVIEPAAVRKIVADSGVTAGTRVVEVGPGLGSLTLALLEAGAVVSAIEIDPVLAEALPNTVCTYQPTAANRFAVLRADALSIKNPEQLAVPRAVATHSVSGDMAADAPTAGNRALSLYEPTHMVANLPYNVAVPILLTLLAALPSLRHVTVMVQAEVADRLAALPGSKVYGVPSAKLAWYGHARRGAKISRTVFWPVPNVDSALVHVELHRSRDRELTAAGVSDVETSGVGAPEAHTSGVGIHGGTNAHAGAAHEPTEEAGERGGAIGGNPHGVPADLAGAPHMELCAGLRDQVFAVIDAAFSQRRKTLRSALATWAGSTGAAEHILRAAGVDPRLRGEKLALTDFVAIARARLQEGAS